ncbi:MAG: hypothetical protein U0531_07725 [Dehalococcoidia bacterium]
MAAEIPVGTSNETTVTVTADMSPPHLKDVQVLSTPSMIQLMEVCALEAMRPFLTAEETSVGTAVCITHDAALRGPGGDDQGASAGDGGAALRVGGGGGRPGRQASRRRHAHPRRREPGPHARRVTRDRGWSLAGG